MDISPYRARQWVPLDADLTNTRILDSLFATLMSRLRAACSVADLESSLQAHDELAAAIDETKTRRYIAMTCQTDDPEKERAYLHILETVEPWLKPRQFEFLKALAAHSAFDVLPADYTVFRHSVHNQIDLYREANVPRETEVAKLSQQYQKLSGAMTVVFDGEERTLAQMAPVLEETDRARRQRAWELIQKRRLQDAGPLENIFDLMLGWRGKIAQEAGFDNYRDYIFKRYERFDYSPRDCEIFHDSIEKFFTPLLRDLQEKRRKKLGVDRLRPWDLAVDPDQYPPLHPFKTADELMAKTLKIFQGIDSRLGNQFSILQERKLIDLENRKGKAPGGYQSTLEEARLPFIFMNAVGIHHDVETLLHEAGHAFHALAAREQKLYAYLHAPIEFCEVASMGMELLAASGLVEFYSPEDVRRAQRNHLEGIIKIFPWIAIIDAFQHWVYTHPHHVHEDRCATFVSLMNRFGGVEDWSGYEKEQRYAWHRQLHVFECPFYYIEYGIAQLGALQLWLRFAQEPRVALDAYLSALALGGSKTLPELFSAAGIQFDFSPKTIEPLAEALKNKLAQLEG